MQNEAPWDEMIDAQRPQGCKVVTIKWQPSVDVRNMRDRNRVFPESLNCSKITFLWRMQLLRDGWNARVSRLQIVNQFHVKPTTYDLIIAAKVFKPILLNLQALPALIDHVWSAALHSTIQRENLSVDCAIGKSASLHADT